MGSKNLKAVVVSGKQVKELVDAKKFNKLKKEFAKKVANSGLPQVLKKFGTAGTIEYLSSGGMLPY